MSTERGLHPLVSLGIAENDADLERKISERRALLVREYGGEFSDVSVLSSFLVELGMGAEARRDLIAQHSGAIFPVELV